MDLQELAGLVTARRAAAGRPIVVGISGYGGSGKSTLARELVEALPDAVRMRGDDFLDPVRVHERSADWDGVERDRLATEVLRPFREGVPGEFRRFDWDLGRFRDPEPVPRADVLVVDLIGLFHPETLPLLDLTVWCEVDLDTAVQRGMLRDRRAGHDHDRVWTDVWAANERDFESAFGPREVADVRFPTG
ncbi:phosphoglycerate transporter [Aeromicrobium senzhongii]|uniref:Phosphoglycerate transporter n=1 Tax=Aeromicrobium senzhongii TaxID=2663859 RepID=A0ABX6ST80_9ACTN|nr:phosphoglycerate transporter [Aeromicrobium senzhongii]MTB89515.1 phosphoglycerate transporter [Aeromicrobium senzhongii]QNL94352.1 phosphoglycerate transporter [Aeromicrobium senzhongii]